MIILFLAYLHTATESVVTNIIGETCLHVFLSPFRMAYCMVRSCLSLLQETASEFV